MVVCLGQITTLITIQNITLTHRQWVIPQRKLLLGLSMAVAIHFAHIYISIPYFCCWVAHLWVLLHMVAIISSLDQTSHQNLVRNAHIVVVQLFLTTRWVWPSLVFQFKLLLQHRSIIDTFFGQNVIKRVEVVFSELSMLLVGDLIVNHLVKFCFTALIFISLENVTVASILNKVFFGDINLVCTFHVFALTPSLQSYFTLLIANVGLICHHHCLPILLQQRLLTLNLLQRLVPLLLICFNLPFSIHNCSSILSNLQFTSWRLCF